VKTPPFEVAFSICAVRKTEANMSLRAIGCTAVQPNSNATDVAGTDLQWACRLHYPFAAYHQREITRVRIAQATIASVLLCAVFIAGCNTERIKPIENGDDIGVVLMHGKGGGTNWVDPLASSLRSASISVITPSLPWHRNRIYDRTFEQSMAEIEGHVAKMRSSGAKRVYVAGHSLGAVAAAGYAAQYDDIDGIILLAPGHFTAWPGFNRRFVDDLAKAQSMIAAGNGSEKANFGDINAGKTTSRRLSAEIYWSWFSDTGPAEFVSNMESVKGGIPILYVAGSRDRIPQTKNRQYAFDLAPPNPRSQFTIIDASHLDVPRLADDLVVNWLRGQ
jgi:pimeloyl-ACP methyl ester carboxylesterase